MTHATATEELDGGDMEQFVQSVEQSIANANWHAAVALAFTLPDITIGMEMPKLNNGQRFAEFHRRYMRPLYEVAPRGSEGWDFFTAAFASAMDKHLRGEITAAQYEHELFGRFPHAPRECWFGPEDFYGLRCAILHAGSPNQTFKQGRVYERFALWAPRPGVRHLNILNETLQLQVDILCRQICHGTREWDSTVGAGLRATLDDELLKF